MKKLVIAVIVIAVLGAGAYLWLGRGSLPVAASQATPEPTDIPPAIANRDVVADAVVVPAQQVELSVAAAGVAAEVLVAEGEQVVAGQALLRLENSRQAAGVAQAEAGLLRAQAALGEAQAAPRPEEIAAAQAAVDAANAALARATQGARPEEIAAAEAAVAAAQAGVQKAGEGPREESLIAARADVANAEAVLRGAQAAYDRVKDQPGVGARPESVQLEQATNGYNAATARLAALQAGGSPADLAAARAEAQRAQAQLDALKAPARPADVEAAQADVRRAEAQLALLQAGPRAETIAAAEAEVAAAEAALEQAQAALAETELRAPIAGAVAALYVKAGEQVSPAAPALVLADLSTWKIETADLTEINAVRVRPGDPATISFDALPDVEIAGSVERVRAVGEKKMGDMTYTVIVAPAETDSRLLWNMTATVVITPEE